MFLVASQKSPLVKKLATPSDITIGVSEKGLPISLHYLGSQNAAVRILVIAGQHGDEPLASQAVEQLINQGSVPDNCCAALIPCLNPDARASNNRKNACGIDLNRDHQLLSSQEVKALHAFARYFKPQLIIDVHTYPPRRKHLLRQGLVYHHDVFVDVANTPALSNKLQTHMLKSLLPTILSELNTTYAAERYTLINASGRVRHSSPDVTNARNMLALRCGAASLLLEGKQIKQAEGAGRTIKALEKALRAAIAWASEEGEKVKEGAFTANVAVQSCYQESKMPVSLLFCDSKTQQPKRVTLPGKYTPELSVKEWVSVPRAYLIPKALPKLIKVLQSHGYVLEANSAATAACYHIGTFRPSSKKRKAVTKLELKRTERNIKKDDYLKLSVNRETAASLLVLLEPNSKYGLCRYEELGLSLKPQTPYPVLRLDVGESKAFC